MATGTMSGDNYTVESSPTPSTLLRPGQGLGKVAVISDYVEILNAWNRDAGSIVMLGGKIPKGAIPLFGIFEYAGSCTATAKLGSSDNDDLFGTVTAMTSTKQQILAPTVPNEPLSADTYMQLLTAADALDSGDTIRLQYFFSIP